MLDRKEPLIAGVREDEVYFALKTLNPEIGFVPLYEKVKEIENVLNPKTQLRTLVGVDTFEERQEAVTKACEMACAIMEYFLLKDKHLADELGVLFGEEQAMRIMADADKIAMTTLSINQKGDQSCAD